MMRPIRKLLFLGLTLLLVAMAAPLPARADMAALNFGLMADKSSYKTGDIVKVTLTATGMTDLYGFEAVLTYDPDQLEWKGLAADAYSDGGMYTVTKTPEDNAVTVTRTKMSDVPGINGSGNLAVLTFTAKGVGVSKIRLDRVEAFDSNLRPTRWNAGYELSVSYANSAPAPGSSGAGNPIGNSKPDTGASPTFQEVALRGDVKAGIFQMDRTQLEAAAEDGKKVVPLVVPYVKDVEMYVLQMPVSALNGSSKGKLLYEIRTEFGSLSVPDRMLSNLSLPDTPVELRIARADISKLSAAVQEAIGSRPVLNLALAVNGRETVWSNPSAPVTVSLAYTPSKEELQHPERITVWYIDGAGAIHSVPNGRYDAKTGQVIFRTTHFSHYAVVFPKVGFSDLSGTEWARPAVEAMAARGVIRGTSEGVFTPDMSIKRADFMLMLMRALELPPASATENTEDFLDVEAGSYAYAAVRQARSLGLTLGDGSNRFLPESPITREDVMVLTARSLSIKGETLPSSAGGVYFKDEADISGYARASIEALSAAGIVKGYEGAIQPKMSLTRAEAAVLIHNLLSR
ncbi:S-layer homology domain-containing protein [Gorillibacterium sp. sgz5001074]|uniref:S-layer homology domain-containing protein n=1 Tax=Gorillibacterium sp. sgz5001074 TaxID=3446695 RepID=UPI003F67A22E